MKAILILLTASFFAMSAFCQDFINLDFESGTFTNRGYFSGPLQWEDAAPGWQPTQSTAWSTLYLNLELTGGEQIYKIEGAYPLAGNYSFKFSSGMSRDNDPNAVWVDASISQTGRIPRNTRSIRLLARGPFQIFVNGVLIPMNALPDNVYVGNISRFAGRVAELRIVNTKRLTGAGHTMVDNIEFSSISLPAWGMRRLHYPSPNPVRPEVHRSLQRQR